MYAFLSVSKEWLNKYIAGLRGSEVRDLYVQFPWLFVTIAQSVVVVVVPSGRGPVYSGPIR